MNDDRLNLVEFARIVKTGREVTGENYVRLMKKVLPLDDLRNLTPDEAYWFSMAVAWLYDYSILLVEFHAANEGRNLEMAGSPCVTGASGPFIDHCLTRSAGDPPDFRPLFSFRVASDQGHQH